MLEESNHFFCNHCNLQLQLCHGDWKLFVGHLIHVLHNGMSSCLLKIGSFPRFVPIMMPMTWSPRVDLGILNSYASCLMHPLQPWIWLLSNSLIFHFLFPTLDDLFLIRHCGWLLLPSIRWASKPTTWLAPLHCISFHLLNHGLQCRLQMIVQHVCTVFHVSTSYLLVDITMPRSCSCSEPFCSLSSKLINWCWCNMHEWVGHALVSSLTPYVGDVLSLQEN